MKELIMTFLIAAIVSGVYGFAGVSGSSAIIGQTFFVVFGALFIISLAYKLLLSWDSD